MIRITIEMVPKATRPPRHMATIEIWNDGSSDSTTSGNYVAELSQVSKTGVPGSKWKMVGVHGFPRSRLTVYDLLLRVLREAVGDRNV